MVGRRPSLRIYYLWLSFEHQSPDLLKTKPFDLFETIELEFKRGPNLHILATTSCWVCNHVEADGPKMQKIVKIISYYFLSSKVCTWRHDNGNDQPGPWLKFLRMKSSSLNVAREGNIPPNFFQVTQNKQKMCCQVKSFFTSQQKIDLFQRAANTSVKVKVEGII